MNRADTLQARRALDDAGPDRVLMVTVGALLCAGIVMVYSASIATNSETLELNFHHLLRQGLHIALGGLLLVIAALVKLEWLQRAARALLALALLLLAAVLIPGIGIEVNGGLRWIDVGGFRVQPSEVVKIAVIIYFADYFARKHDDLHRFRVGVINVGLVVGVIGILLFLEPDFGASAVIVVTVAAMMFLAGVRFWHFCTSIGIAGALMTALVWMEPYRMQRLMSHRDPWADPFDGGFQLVQALIAIGRGEWFGIGLGSSILKLFYLPHVGTDFLIAVIGEELGALGIFAVVILYALLLWRAFVIGGRALDQGQPFGGFLAQGIGLLIALQAAIHIGVNIGLLPTKGLTLPLMSYGGSSLLSCMAAVGLLFAVDRHTRARHRTRHQTRHRTRRLP